MTLSTPGVGWELTENVLGDFKDQMKPSKEYQTQVLESGTRISKKWKCEECNGDGFINNSCSCHAEMASLRNMYHSCCPNRYGKYVKNIKGRYE